MFGLTPRRLWPLVMVGGLLAALAVAAVVATPGIKSVPIPRIWESAAGGVAQRRRAQRRHRPADAAADAGAVAAARTG